jgi:hypothetical protein
MRACSALGRWKGSIVNKKPKKAASKGKGTKTLKDLTAKRASAVKGGVNFAVNVQKL